MKSRSFLKSLLKSFPSIRERYWYFEDNVAIVHKKDLSLILGVSDRSIETYHKKGLLKSKVTTTSVPMYELIYAIDWYRSNINTKHRETKPSINNDNIHPDLELWIKEMKKWETVPLTHLPKDEIERRISVKEYIMKDVKAKLITEEVIESDKVDFAKAEAAVTILSHLRSLKKLLPSLVNPQNPHIVTPILDREFKQSVDSMHNFVNLQIPEESNSKFWDVIKVVMGLLEDGKTPKELIRKLNV